MSINAPEPLAARKDLEALVSQLEATSASIDAAQMILSCRRILDLWLAMGGSSLDDPVVGFLGVESQTYHVLRQAGSGRNADGVRFVSGSPEEAAEIEDCGRWFLEGFRSDVAALSAWLIGSSHDFPKDPEAAFHP